MKCESILRQVVINQNKKICGHPALNLRAEAVGPQGQAGSAWVKSHLLIVSCKATPPA